MYPTLELFGLKLSSFVLFNSIAFFSAYIIIYLRFKTYERSKKDYFVTISIITFLGFIGSKLFYIFEDFSTFIQNPIDVFFSFEGSGFFGGFILVLLALKIYFKHVLTVLDAIILCVPVGIIFGRMGCFLAGDGCYGPPTTVPWAMTFPEGIMPTHIPVHPTQLYEILLNSIIVIALLFYEKKYRIPGETLGFYFILSGVTRFFIEFYRINIDVFFGLSAQQLFSFMFVGLGLFLLKHRLKKLTVPMSPFTR